MLRSFELLQKYEPKMDLFYAQNICRHSLELCKKRNGENLVRWRITFWDILMSYSGMP